jgi:hypothetical protein
MANFLKYYDRVKVFIDGSEYNPGGELQSCSIDFQTNSKTVPGSTVDGSAVGVVAGNYKLIITITELFYDMMPKELLDITENQILVIVPFSTGGGEAIGDTFQLSCVIATSSSSGFTMDNATTRVINIEAGKWLNKP